MAAKWALAHWIFRSQLIAVKQGRAFGFGNKIDMLDRSLVEGNRPVRVVLAYRRADEKAAGQLDIHGNFVANIQLVGKAALVIGIVNHIIVQAAVGGHGVYALSAVQVCQHKDVGAVRFLQLVVGDMLNDHIRLLVVDDFPRLDDKVLRVQLIKCKQPVCFITHRLLNQIYYN